MRAATEYTFESLRGNGISDSLVYVVGLANSPEHKISEVLAAKRILSYLFDIEEQAPGGKQLVSAQDSFCSRYFSGGYFPLTPCMLTKGWSPIAAMLERGIDPLVLSKADRPVYATATGLWNPCAVGPAERFENCKTVQDLFWAILSEASRRATERQMWISVIACPGWRYDTKIDSLPRWNAQQIADADRILWRRTPDDAF